MPNKKITILLAMLVLAIFAVGSVSADENIITDIDEPADDIIIDEVDDTLADDVVEYEEQIVQTTSTVTTYNVNNTFTSSDIESYFNYADDTNKVVINFANESYTNIALDLSGYSNIELCGNGATLNGDGTHDIFTVTNTNYIVIKDFIINVDSGAAAIYGHHVTNSVYTNNIINGGKDGINIFQVHENLTITDNTISGFARDGISLVNFLTMDDSTWNSFVASNISGNKITGGEYGMFFGGNFKGTIADNIIEDSEVGVEFAGKRVATNGKLCVVFNNNTITNVLTGINMYHPNVICFNLTNSDIEVDSEEGEYAILTNNNFNTTGYIGVYNSTFVGSISSAFKTAAGNNTGNNSGF